MRKLRRRGPGPIVLTAGLFIAAGVGAGGIMFSDRLNDMWYGQDWSEPSAAWMALFNEKAAPTRAGTAKVENAVLITQPPAPRLPDPPIPLVQEPARRSADAPRPPEAPLVAAAGGQPGSTSSLSAASAGARDLPWLPEAEKRVEALEANAAPPPPRVAVSAPAPEVGPIPSPAPSPAASSPVVAPSSLSIAVVADLIKRARGHIELGDIAGARLLLERAAAGSEPSALMALAETYDPTMLAKWGARGLKADAGKARALYLKASERGLAEANARMLALR
jgi:TPR repeat protein